MKYKTADFKIVCNPENMQTARDLLADAAGEVGFESFEDTPWGIQGYIPVHLLSIDALDRAIELLPLEGTQITYFVSDTEDKNWNEAWEANGFSPIDIEGKIEIFDAKMPHQAHNTEKLYIGIEAKQAFGTGTHQTTRMIVAALLHIPLEEKRVLDCGCGTGILGIAASLLGAKDVVAYDIDEWSVANTQHNATLNGVNNLEVLHGDVQVLSHVSGMFDVVVANINRNILLDDMHNFSQLMHTGAQLLLSGFYESDAEQLLAKGNELGLYETYRMTDDNWCCLILTKK